MTTTPTPSTRLGPLTTTYTPSGSSCSRLYYATNGVPAEWLGLGPIDTAYATSSCMPPGYTRAPQFYYSPGICPLGYTVACSSSTTIDSAVTTTATCCAIDYVCDQMRASDNVYGCTSLITSETVFIGISVNYITTTIGNTTTYPVETSTITTSLTQDQYYVKAHAIIIQRGSNDPLFQAEETEAPSSVATDSGLSVGAKVGLGVGVSLAALLFFGAIAFFLIKRKRKGTGSDEGPRPPDEMGPRHSPDRAMEISELHQSSASLPQSQFQQFGSLNYTAPHQLRADKSPIEMLADTPAIKAAPNQNQQLI